MEKINSHKRPYENYSVKSGTKHKKVCARAYVTRRTSQDKLTDEQIQAKKILTNMNIKQMVLPATSKGERTYNNVVRVEGNKVIATDGYVFAQITDTTKKDTGEVEHQHMEDVKKERELYLNKDLDYPNTEKLREKIVEEERIVERFYVVKNLERCLKILKNAKVDFVRLQIKDDGVAVFHAEKDGKEIAMALCNVWGTK